MRVAESLENEPMMAHLHFALLGPVQITLADSTTLRFDYRKVQALLVYLVVERQQAHRREVLAELLWPNQPAEKSRGSLRQALATLRQILPDRDDVPLLLVTRATVQFNPAGDYTLDSATFDKLRDVCDTHPHDLLSACAECIERYDVAAGLYRGSFASDLVVEDCPEFDEWLTHMRERFAQAALDTLDRLAHYAEVKGDTPRALSYARRQLTIDPWRDDTHLQVMRLLAAQGQRAAAVEHYNRYRRQVDDELGIEPAAEVAALYTQLLAADTPLGEPEQDVPPASYPLPPQPTSMVGREADISELIALLHTPACRMLTLLGPGGIGKTRLALRLAETAAPAFRHGVCWVSLADVEDATQLVRTVIQSLDPTYEDTRPARAALLAFVQHRQLLLVLDNIEHLLDGASVLVELLTAAPRLKIMLTSRERLRLAWEWVYQVNGLSFPSPPYDNNTNYAAVELVLERARQIHQLPAHTDVPAVMRIAHLTHGMPLAIELAVAAARGRSYTAIADSLEHTFDLLQTRLRDLPTRHRSMRAALEHSWRLLDGEEQAALARLSVFREGLEVAAARAVAGVGELLLDDLADKSLVRHDNGRYRWHELIRQFAYEQLQATGAEARTSAAHLDYFVSLAVEAGPQLMGQDQEVWLRRLEQEHANIRAALTWGLVHNPAAAARLAGALWRFWWMRGYVHEGRGWLQRVLDDTSQLDAATRAQVSKGAGALAYVQGDYEVARQQHEAALAMERELGNERGIANASHNLALTLSAQGSPGKALPLFEEVLAIHQRLGNDNGVAVALDGMAEAALALGDYEWAHKLFTQSLARHEIRGDRHSATVTRYNLASLALLRGDTHDLANEVEECLAHFREIGSTQGVAVSQHLLGKIALRAGDSASARAYFIASLEVLQQGNFQHDLAACLVGFALVAGHGGQWQRAAVLCGAADALCHSSGGALDSLDQLDSQRVLDQARAAQGAEAIEAAWAFGRTLTKEAMIQEALRESS